MVHYKEYPKGSQQQMGINCKNKAGAPNKEKLEKGLECSFLLSRIVLRPFKGIFARAKHYLICSDVVVGNSNDKERNFIPRI